MFLLLPIRFPCVQLRVRVRGKVLDGQTLRETSLWEWFFFRDPPQQAQHGGFPFGLPFCLFEQLQLEVFVEPPGGTGDFSAHLLKGVPTTKRPGVLPSAMFAREPCSGFVKVP